MPTRCGAGDGVRVTVTVAVPYDGTAWAGTVVRTSPAVATAAAVTAAVRSRLVRTMTAASSVFPDTDMTPCCPARLAPGGQLSCGTGTSGRDSTPNDFARRAIR